MFHSLLNSTSPTSTTTTSNSNTSTEKKLTKREQVDLLLNSNEYVIYTHEWNSILKDPLYNSNKITQVLEEISKFDRDYVDGITQDLEPKVKFKEFLDLHIQYLYDNQLLNQLLACKSLLVRNFISNSIFKHHFQFDREKISLSLLIDASINRINTKNSLNSDQDFKFNMLDLLETNLDKTIGKPDAKTVYQKFLTTDISKLFSIVFLEDENKKQDRNSVLLVKFLALNSLQNIEDIQNIASLKSSYLKLLGYIFKYNTPETSKKGNTTIGECKVPLLFFINKYFGDSDTNDVGWKLFSQWTKSITSSSIPRKLMNAIGLLNSFGTESTLVKNHIDVILVCLEKIFFCTKNEGLRDMNTQCLNDIIKSNPNSVPLKMANRFTEFIFKSPGFFKNLKAISEKGIQKRVFHYYESLFQTLNRYIPGCGIKYALDIANLKGKTSYYFIDEYFSGIDPQELKNHPNYQDIREMFHKEKYLNSLISHSGPLIIVSLLCEELTNQDYIKIIKKLKTDPDFLISAIKPPIEKIMNRILDTSRNLLGLEEKQFIIHSFSLDADVDFLLQIIHSMLGNSKFYYFENNSNNLVDCIKLLLEVNPSKTIPFVKNNLFNAITNVQVSIFFAHDLYRLVDLNDEVVRIINNVNDISYYTPKNQIQNLILSLSSDIIYQFYSEFLKEKESSNAEFIKLHLEFLNNPKLELYGHNRVELVKIFVKYFLQPSNNIPKNSMKFFLDLFHYIEPNDLFIQEFKSGIKSTIKTIFSKTLEMLVFIQSNKIKSLYILFEEFGYYPSNLEINEKSLESKDINSVSALTQITIVRDIIKFYFSSKTIKIREILNLCHVSKLFLSVCQNLFRQVPYKTSIINGIPWSPGSSSKFHIETTPFSLAHKGIYHMHYGYFYNVYHNKINEIFYQLSSLSIINPYLIYEPTKDLNELVHLEIIIVPYQQKEQEEMTFFKRVPALESIRLKFLNHIPTFFKDFISQSLKYCPNLKEMYIKVRIYDSDTFDFKIFIEGIEMLKSHAANSGGSFKYYIDISKDDNTNNPSYSKLLPNINKVKMNINNLNLLNLDTDNQSSPVVVPHLKITAINDFPKKHFDFKALCPKKITFGINQINHTFGKYFYNLLKTARLINNHPTELTFKFQKQLLWEYRGISNEGITNFIDGAEEILTRCTKAPIPINVINIQHINPIFTNVFQIHNFSKYRRHKLISPVSGRFEYQQEFEDEYNVSDDSMENNSFSQSSDSTYSDDSYDSYDSDDSGLTSFIPSN